MPFYRMDDGTLVGEYLDLVNGGIVPRASIDASSDPFYQRAERKWQLGIVQGFVAAPEDRPDLVVGFLYYRAATTHTSPRARWSPPAPIPPGSSSTRTGSSRTRSSRAWRTRAS